MVKSIDGHGQTPEFNKLPIEIYSQELHHTIMGSEAAAEDIIMEDVPNMYASAKAARSLSNRSVTWNSGNKAGGPTDIAALRLFKGKSFGAQAERLKHTGDALTPRHGESAKKPKVR